MKKLNILTINENIIKTNFNDILMNSQNIYLVCSNRYLAVLSSENKSFFEQVVITKECSFKTPSSILKKILNQNEIHDLNIIVNDQCAEVVFAELREANKLERTSVTIAKILSNNAFMKNKISEASIKWVPTYLKLKKIIYTRIGECYSYEYRDGKSVKYLDYGTDRLGTLFNTTYLGDIKTSDRYYRNTAMGTGLQ